MAAGSSSHARNTHSQCTWCRGHQSCYVPSVYWPRALWSGDGTLQKATLDKWLDDPVLVMENCTLLPAVWKPVTRLAWSDDNLSRIPRCCLTVEALDMYAYRCHENRARGKRNALCKKDESILEWNPRDSIYNDLLRHLIKHASELRKTKPGADPCQFQSRVVVNSRRKYAVFKLQEPYDKWCQRAKRWHLSNRTQLGFRWMTRGAYKLQFECTDPECKSSRSHAEIQLEKNLVDKLAAWCFASRKNTA